MRALLRSRALSALLLAAVLLGRLLVPGGWMPERTAQGFAIAMCSGSGPMQAWLDQGGHLHSGKPDKPNDDHAKDPCPYGALSAAGQVPAGPAAEAPVLAAVEAPAQPARAVAIGRGLAAPPPFATGPPLSA
jgi:hypothetical protein